MIKDSYKKDFFWNMLGSLFYGFASMFLIMAVNYISGAAVSGMFSIAFATAQMMMFLGNYGVRVYQSSDVQEKVGFYDYFFNRICTCFFMMLSIVVFSLIRNYRGEMFLLVVVVGFYKMMDALADVYEGRFQQKDFLFLSGRSLFFRTFISTIILIVILMISKNILVASIWMAVSSVILFFIFCIVPNKKYSFNVDIKKVECKNILFLFKDCFSLFIAFFLLSYIVNSSKYAMENYLPYEFQTYFNAFYFPAQVVYLFTSFVFKPLILTFAKYWADKTTRYRVKKMVNKLFLGILVSVFVTMVIAFFIGIPILSFLFRIDLKDYKLEMLVMLFGGGGIAFVNMLYNILTVMRMQNWIMIICVLIFSLSLIVPSVLVRKFGLLGATISYDILLYAFAMVLFVIYLVKTKGVESYEEKV